MGGGKYGLFGDISSRVSHVSAESLESRRRCWVEGRRCGRLREVASESEESTRACAGRPGVKVACEKAPSESEESTRACCCRRDDALEGIRSRAHPGLGGSDPVELTRG